MPATKQIAIIQSKSSNGDELPLAISHSQPVPELPTPYHVLVRVSAVGLNPTDHKMVTHFYMEGRTVGCDFCGVIESAGPSSLLPVGTRVCGADFPYRKNNAYNGAFSERVSADSRQMLVVPDDWSDVQGAALGAIGWGTVCMSLSDPEALGLAGLPSKPLVSEKPIYVLVYGAGTATGVLTIQILKYCGYSPIAVCSQASASFAMSCGAVGTASYTSTTCVDDIKSIAGGAPIRFALDCITDADSAAICFASLGRAGGRYACLEEFQEAWHTRRAVKVKVVMGFEMQANDVDVGHPVYSRKPRQELHEIGMVWAKEMQQLMNSRMIKTLPVHEVEGKWEGVVKGLNMLKNGEVKGKKLVIKV